MKENRVIIYTPLNTAVLVSIILQKQWNVLLLCLLSHGHFALMQAVQFLIARS